MVRTGATFADAAEECLRYIEHDRGRKPSTLGISGALAGPAAADVRRAARRVDHDPDGREVAGDAQCRSRRLQANAHQGVRPDERRAEARAQGLRTAVQPGGRRREAARRLPPRQHRRLLARRDHELVDAAASEQDGAIYLTAAFTGLRRGELLALRWRDVDVEGSTLRVRASYADGALTTPKSGKVRSVPMAPERRGGADATAGAGSLGGRRRPGVRRRGRAPTSTAARSVALPAALEASGAAAAALPRSAPHVRHRVIGVADIRRVQEWMGHADIKTTMRYFHYPAQEDAAERLSRAFAARPEPARAITER